MINIKFFSGKNCSVCSAVKPKIKDLCNQYEIPVEEIDTNINATISAQNMVFSIPAVLIFDDDKELNRWVRNFSIKEIEDYINRIK